MKPRITLDKVVFVFSYLLLIFLVVGDYIDFRIDIFLIPILLIFVEILLKFFKKFIEFFFISEDKDEKN